MINIFHSIHNLTKEYQTTTTMVIKQLFMSQIWAYLLNVNVIARVLSNNRLSRMWRSDCSTRQKQKNTLYVNRNVIFEDFILSFFSFRLIPKKPMTSYTGKEECENRHIN